MKKVLIAILVIVSLALVYKFGFSQDRFVSVLVFSKTMQYRHESIEAGKNAIMTLGKENGFDVYSTEDASDFNEKNLSQYNVVIFLNTTGDVLNDQQQLEFNRFIQAGGGFVGIHAATDTEYGWPWYGQLVGAYFESHPNDPNVRSAKVIKVDANHPSSAMLPDVWECVDEWYNYKNISPEINVLLNLDEDSYEGGTNGDQHPISWYQEFDGGRSWYTGRGHTPESFAEPLFLEHLLAGINYVAGEGQPVDYNQASIAPEENRFVHTVLEDNLNEPMELEILPDGKLIFIERDGDVHVFDPEVDSSAVIEQVEVFSGLEDGLLGMALDPDFESNNWIYFFHSEPEESFQNVSRFTMASDYKSIDMSSRKTLLTIPTQRDECCHSAGSLEFGPDGLLFISVGDNTNPHASDGFSPGDEQEGRSPWDAQKSSSNTNDLRGKILRIKPENDGTYSIPDGNLFPQGQEGTRPEIYVMGCRNPYRMGIDQHNGILYWGEVGPDAGNDSVGRGPRGYDEVNQAKSAGFYGWPYFIANNKPYNEYDFGTQTSSALYDVEKPINNSPNNTGIKELPPAQEAFIWYPYAASEEFPLVGDGGRNAMAGPVFYSDDYVDNENKFPPFFDGKLFTYDWMRGWIMTITLDENNNYQRMERFMPSRKYSNPTDMIFGPNGDMYILEYGTVWFSENPDARLVHIRYNAGNREPLAEMSIDKRIGAAPLTANFSAENSKDFDGDELSYQWYFSNSETVSSEELTPVFTFEKPGKYNVRLVVTDPSGESSEITEEIMVGNELPSIAWNFEGNRTFYWDNQTLDYEVSVTDAEDGSLGNGISADQVNITIDYLAQGFDENEIALGHKALQEASAFLSGKQLIESSDCSTCHQMEVRSVGPSYKEIAARYADDPDAESNLAQKVINGGGGVWGDIAMAAHPQLNEEEARQMISYILSNVNGAKSVVPGLSPKGTTAFDKHEPENTEGKYLMIASYTDRGGPVIGPLTAREVIVLRHPLIWAAKFSKNKKAQKFTVTEDMSQGMFEGELDLVIGENQGYVSYANIDLTDVKSIKLSLAEAGPYFSGGMLQFHLDDINNPSIAEVEVETSLTDFGLEELYVNIPETRGVHELFISFSNDGGKPVSALISLEFSNKTSEPNM